MAGSSPTSATPLSCGECGSSIEPGQRYCLQCGARRGQLPLRVAGTLGALYERGRPPIVAEPVAEPEAEPATESEPEPEPEAAEDAPPDRLNWRVPLGPKLPTPRAASMAVLAMLGFGVILGSLGHVSVQELASAPSLILNLPTGGGSSGPSAGGPSGGSGGGGGSGGQQTQTITVGGGTAPGFSAGTGSGGTSSGSGPTSTTPTGFNSLPPIQHVFLVMLSQQGYNETFSTASTDSYLNKTLATKGELIQNYYGVAGSPLANEIALLSGQGPTQQTAANCPTYNAISPSTSGSAHQVLGDGCVYPSSTKTLMDQLTADHKTWKAYIEGMTAGCSHPTLGGANGGPTSTSKPYAQWTNPFVFFLSVTGSKNCRKDDVGLGQLKKDLKSESTTPSFAYIAPSPCDDGSAQPCAPGAPAGLAPADKFLKSVLAEIESSAAYKSGGLIAITSDEAPQTGTGADSTSCCNQPTFPNVPAPIAPTSTTTTPTTTPTGTTTTPTSTDTTTTSTDTTTTSTDTTTTSTETTPTTLAAPGTPPGGGEVGLLLLSKWVKPNNPDPIDTFNHFSLLKGIEELFGLKYLGYAGASGVLTWTSSAVFTGTGP
jgi:hypothetical protein